MKVLLLSCSTGEGHNHCAAAVREELERRGAEVGFLDLLRMSGEPGPFSFDKILNRISSNTPEIFGMMYRAGATLSSTGVTSPIYLANTRYADKLAEFIAEKAYDAVVCSHLFPMETMTDLRRHGKCYVPFYGVLSDYTCIPFLAETKPDVCFLPHEDVKKECVAAGIAPQRLLVTGMPVSAKFCARTSKADAREALGLPAGKKIYLIMTGGIGCGDAVALCNTLLRIPDENSLLCVLPGRNEELRRELQTTFPSGEVLTVPFTDKVPLYMRASDVLLSKAGGISSSEAAVAGVPLVHTMIIPGVETQNAEFFEQHGMSLFAKNAEEAARFADRLVYDTSAAERMLLAQRRTVPPDGAEKIAEFILTAGSEAHRNG